MRTPRDSLPGGFVVSAATSFFKSSVDSAAGSEAAVAATELKKMANRRVKKGNRNEWYILNKLTCLVPPVFPIFTVSGYKILRGSNEPVLRAGRHSKFRQYLKIRVRGGHCPDYLDCSEPSV